LRPAEGNPSGLRPAEGGPPVLRPGEGIPSGLRPAESGPPGLRPAEGGATVLRPAAARGPDRAPRRDHDLDEVGREREGGGEASAEAVTVVLGLFTEMGFDPEPDGDDRILLHACPFRVTAQAHPEVVCAAHRGLLRATIARFDPDAPVPDLHAFARPDLCVATLSP
jgi:hypothetical protein